MDIKNDIGKRIKERREELKMSQDELAAKAGYTSRSAISRIEKGENDLTQSKIVKFAKILNTTPSWLMGWTESHSDKPVKQISPKIKFNSAEDAVQFLLSLPMVEAYGGYDLEKMTDQEKVDFASEVSQMIQVLSKRYSRGN